MGKKQVSPSDKTIEEKLKAYNKLKSELDALTAEIKQSRALATPLLKKLNKLSDKVYDLVGDAEELLDSLSFDIEELDSDELQDALQEAAGHLKYVATQLS